MKKKAKDATGQILTLHQASKRGDAAMKSMAAEQDRMVDKYKDRCACIYYFYDPSYHTFICMMETWSKDEAAKLDASRASGLSDRII